MSISFKDEQTKRKFFIMGGCILAAILIIIIAVAILAGSLSGDKKYSDYYEDAQLAYLTRDYDEAIANAKKAIEAKPTEECYILMADIYMAKNDTDAAINTLYTGYSKVGGDKISAYLEELKKSSGEEAQVEKVLVAGSEVSKDATSFVSPKAGLRDEDIVNLNMLPELRNINLSGNLLTSLSITNLSKCESLEYLDLSNNTITDIRDIGSCSTLKHLYLDNNRIEDFSPLYDLKHLTTLSLKGIEMTQKQYDALCDALPGCSIFTGELTEDIVEINIGGKTFMSDVKELDLRGLGIDDISALSACTALQKLDLRDNEISDISPLMDLQELRWLCLWNNDVSDLGPLMNMPLEYLDLDGNELRDITALGYIKTLEELWLSNNENIKSLSPLKSLTELTRLGLKNTGLEDEDLSIIESITSLKELNLEENKGITLNRVDELTEALPKCTIATSPDITFQTELGGKKYTSDAVSISADSSDISDISDLTYFNKLETLSLNYNSVKDISSLSDIKSLTRLELGYNNVNDVSPLRNLTSLRNLNLTGNSISTVTALSGLTSLTELHLSYNGITDISALSSLTNLKSLDLDGNAISDISAVAGMTGLTTLSIESTAVKDLSPLYGLSSLRTLHIRSISGITGADIAALRAALPNCVIVADNLPEPTPEPTPAPTPIPTEEPAPEAAAETQP